MKKAFRKRLKDSINSVTILKRVVEKAFIHVKFDDSFTIAKVPKNDVEVATNY